MTFPSPARWARQGAVALTLLWVFTVLSPVGGQEAAPPLRPESGPVAEIPLTEEAVQAQIDHVNKASNIDEAQKKKIIELYQQALQQIRAAAALKPKEKEFAEADATLALLQKQLAEPEPETPTQIGEDVSLAELSQILAERESELADAKKSLAAIEEQIQSRVRRRAEAPKLLGAAKQALEEVKQRLVPGEVAEPPSPLELAERTFLRASQAFLADQINVYEKELASWAVRGSVLTVRRALAVRRTAALEKRVNALQKEVGLRRRKEAAEAVEKARREAATSHPAVREITEVNQKLAEERKGPKAPATLIEQVNRKHDAIEQTLRQLTDDFKQIKERLSASGPTDAVVALLRKKRARLPDPKRHLDEIGAREEEIGRVQVRLYEIEEEVRQWADVEKNVKRIMGRLGSQVAADEQSYVESETRRAIEARLQYLRGLAQDYDSYFEKLVDVDTVQRKLVSQVREYVALVDERLLWSRSTAALSLSEFGRAVEAVAWLAAPSSWRKLILDVGQDVKTLPTVYALFLLVCVVLLVARRRFRTELGGIAALVAYPETDRFSYTVRAFFVTGLLCAPGPAVFWFLAWRLSNLSNSSELVRAAAFGLRRTAPFYLTLAFLRAVCAPSGLGAVHFRWPAKGLTLLRRNLIWFKATAVPLFLAWSIIDGQSQDNYRNSLGRMAFAVMLLATSFFLLKVLRPSGPFIAEAINRSRGGWLDRLKGVWYPLGVIAPTALAALAVLGYYYTAQQLAYCLGLSGLLVLGVMLGYGLAIRWVFVVRRIIAARERARSGQGEDRTEERLRTVGLTGLTVAPEQNILLLNVRARRFLAGLGGFLLLLGLWFVWSDVLPALGILKRIDVWKGISLAELLMAILVGLMTFLAGRNIPGLLEIALLRRLPLDAGVRYAMTAIAGYLITVIGVVIGFGLIGIGWTQVQWLVAAVTVGLGFGLQEIFANFVSGLILLFERPIRIGDTVTVGEINGTVTRIQIRATTILDWNRRELIVPNKEFVTGRLINWTLSDPMVRVVTPVGIASGSDVDLAPRVLLHVGRHCEFAVRDPAPSVLFLGFGDSSLQFELRVFIKDFVNYFAAIDALHTEIDRMFRKTGIEIAFPQRDVHVRSVKTSSPFVIKQERPSQDAGSDEEASETGRDASFPSACSEEETSQQEGDAADV